MYSYFENKSNEIFAIYYTEIHSFDSHFHNKIEIAHCFSGIQKVKIGENIYTLKKGDTAFIFPNTIHEYILCEPISNEQTELIVLICNTELLTKNIPQITTTSPECPIVYSENLSENISLAFRKMANTKNQFELTGWTFIAIAGLMDNISLKPINEVPDLKLAPQIISYIQKNFQKPLTLQHIANEFGYNKSYIAHIFCDNLKIPFRTYLGAVRSEYVANQIKNSNKSLTEISCDAGYNSLNTFCRCFKNHFNKTPSEYKKEIKFFSKNNKC